MYNWLVFAHVFFAFCFILAHGVHAAAMLAFRSEKDPERSLTFFNIVPPINLVRYLTLFMGIPGLIAAFTTIWWRQGWVWASVVLFLIIGVVMYYYGAGYYMLIFDAATQAVEARKSNVDVEAAFEKFEAVRTAPHPIVVSVVGLVGLAIILLLMRFKPF